MKKIFSVIFLFTTLFVYAQQEIDLDAPIPIDPKVTKGVLDNGLTYYVRANSEPQNRAELMLVVKAGSIDEDDNQQGLAHFAEHLAFNGTKNFPKHELLNYFESIGMEFGPEINAYTSFDETVYMLKVPLDSSEYMDKGLQVLYDWACQITDSDEEMENERGVIREEWRGGRNANFRMQQKWLPVFLNNSKYANRLPIGKIDIINNSPAKILRKFRKDWYRPDLQAVIVVGDFNADEMVETVKEKFSKIKINKNPRKKEYFDIPGHKETLVSVATDKEAQLPVAIVFYKHPLENSKTIGDFRRSIMHSLYNSMINNRLAEKTQLPEPPFLAGQSLYSSMFGPINVYQSLAVCHNGKIKEGLKTVLLENERVKRYGFTESELERQKKTLMNYIEKSYNEREQQKSINYVNEYKRNFLMHEEPIPGIEKEYEYFKTFLSDITLNEVNQLAEKWITDENRVVVVTAPEIDGFAVPNEEEVLAILDEAEKEEIEPYEDAVADVPLLSEEPWPGKVVSERNLEKVNALEWTLENGAKVIVKSTDFKDDQVLFNAYSPGGISLYTKDDVVSADFASSIMVMSGISDFDKITLDKMLSDKVFSLSPYVSELREGLTGNSSVKDIEAMLQMVYLYFTQPRFDNTSYQSYMKRMEGILQNKAASPESAFRDTLSVVLANYHERVRPMTVELLKEADFSKIEQIGKERINNAGDFNFFFVGKIDTARLKPLVEKYIGGIPYSDTRENWRNLGIDPPSGVVEKVVKKGIEDKSIQNIVFHGKEEYSDENLIVLNTVGKILSTRLLEVIREDKGGVYYIGARPSLSKYPDEEYSISIYYGTDPKKLGELKEAVFDEIKNYINNGPTETELKKAKEKLFRERELSVRENNFWMGVLTNTYFIKDGDFSEFGNYNDIVKGLTVEKIQKAFNRYFDFNNYVSVSLQPED